MNKDIQFVCDQENGGVLQSDELTEDHRGTINETVALVLEGKHPSETITSCATIETYKETPIFIPVDIMEEAIDLVVRNYQGVLA